MTWNGWAVTLNGVTLVRCDTQEEWDALDCFPTEIMDGLDGPPDGLGLPGLRTEDVTYYQRDGVKHYSDWYEARQITVTGTLGPEDGTCPECSPVRQQLRDLVQAWKRTCCDTEMVIYPDCYQKDLASETNLYPDGSFEVDDDGWLGTNVVSVARVTDPVQVGDGSLQIVWDTDDAGDEFVEGPVLMGTAGDVVRVSAWLYSESGGPSIYLNVADSAGDSAVFSNPVDADDTWYLVQVEYTVPANGEIVPSVVAYSNTVNGNESFVDDVQVQLMNPNVDRDLNGPFGVVGRPRVFSYQWLDRTEQIVQFTARFDAVDHRMYVLDECGTPGYSSCEQIEPGVQAFGICPNEDGEWCLTDEGLLCFDTLLNVPGSVNPVEISVGGTEKVNPTITLFPPLVRPLVQNLTTGEYIQLDTVLDEDDTPVTINTEDGTAFDADGNSLTHLLRGSFFLWMFPGNYEWRLVSNQVDQFDDPGYMTICWRNTVVNA